MHTYKLTDPTKIKKNEKRGQIQAASEVLINPADGRYSRY